MSRTRIVALSVVCCIFGVLALRGPEDYRLVSYVVNVVLAIAAFAFAGRDLTERGWRLGYLAAATYVLPLIGTFAYIAMSNREKPQHASA